MACFAARDTSPAAAGEHDQPRLLFLIREDSAPADKAAIGVAPARVDVSWDAIVDDRTEAMLAVLRAASDEIRALADREGVGSERRRPVGADVHVVLGCVGATTNRDS